jgi:hypothetical protein
VGRHRLRIGVPDGPGQRERGTQDLAVHDVADPPDRLPNRGEEHPRVEQVPEIEAKPPAPEQEGDERGEHGTEEGHAPLPHCEEVLRMSEVPEGLVLGNEVEPGAQQADDDRPETRRCDLQLFSANEATDGFRVLLVRGELRSALDGDAAPERDVAGDVGGGRAGVGIVPGGVAVDLVADPDRVVVGLALPEARGAGVAGHQVLLPDRIWREVAVTLDHDRPVALRYHRSVPDRAHRSPGRGLGVTVAAHQPLADSFECHVIDRIERRDGGP